MIRALSARMSLEELRMLPPVVFVGMRRAISMSGTVSLYPSDLYHIACALLVPIRVYGYQKMSQGTGVGGMWVYVDMVCGSCGAVVSLAWQVSDGLWTVEYWEKHRCYIYEQFAGSLEFKSHLAGTKCLVRWLSTVSP